MKQIRRITAMLMSMMLIFTSSGVTSLAANESSSGATNPSQKGDTGITDYDPNCAAVMRPAWLVYIEKVDNTRTGEPTMSTDANASMTTFSQCKWSAVDEMRYDYPKEFMSPDNSLVEHSFIVVNKGNASFNMNDVHVVMPADNSRPKASAVYAISGNPPASNVGTGTTVISDDILNDPEKIESFWKVHGHTLIQQYQDTYAAEKAKGFTSADLIIEYSMAPVKGSGTSSPLIDSVLGEGNLSSINVFN